MLSQRARLVQVMNSAIDDCDVVLRGLGLEVRRDDIKLSFFHFLKECAEVVSWLEQQNNRFSIIFYKNKLAESIKYASQHAKEFDPAYLPERTVNFHKDSFNIGKEIQRKTLSGTHVTNKSLKATANTTKVFLPVCYGFGDGLTGEALEEVIEYFINEQHILRTNITIFLGPHEKTNQTFERNQMEEKEHLSNWFLRNRLYFMNSGIRILIYSKRNLLVKTGVPTPEWYDSLLYKKANTLVSRMLISQRHVELRTKLIQDVVAYLINQFSFQKDFNDTYKKFEIKPCVGNEQIQIQLAANVRTELIAISNSAENRSSIGSYKKYNHIFQRVLQSAALQVRSNASSQFFRFEKYPLRRKLLAEIREAAYQMFLFNMKVLKEIHKGKTPVEISYIMDIYAEEAKGYDLFSLHLDKDSFLRPIETQAVVNMEIDLRRLVFFDPIKIDLKEEERTWVCMQVGRV